MKICPCCGGMQNILVLSGLTRGLKIWECILTCPVCGGRGVRPAPSGDGFVRLGCREGQ